MKNQERKDQPKFNGKPVAVRKAGKIGLSDSMKRQRVAGKNE